MTAGKVLATGQFEVDPGIFATYEHVVVSNDGTIARTTCRIPTFGFTLFDGTIENVGADGVRFLATAPIASVPDDDVEGDSNPASILLGKMFMLPAAAGTKVTVTTTATSVKFGGVSTTYQTTDSFTTVP
jgi:hypothetical protein